ncbi:MFS transporter [Asanoa ishikariensis]|uniref:MFS transporter, DHA1 family, L-arabinose/isopropyl-beta-D-thiogalactopyranoside export protein/MFS transporter, DHA1 family, inner membrane transport protein n=1 Tax=Asanoa ishikariensis TaxID=137265 RepID=A0A1H3TRV1_9ACTN|nr:MFS transporter [Asanoa ishikariensis]GIF67367.1 MFS transporter [Asanoa ishikariensis]SDZ52860.1 MFS transporter, DHA1 family, L-arabinose/isopropyl-beta-D-thiogalactopyranoside export protein/MFS transporter, DHA1 family, inner membrane transport protein [Asanoa ishikariensis]
MPPQLSPARATATLVALSLAAFAYVTTELAPVGLLTVIAPDLDRSRSEIGLLVTGYAVVVVLMSLPLTHLTKRIPRRRLLAFTFVVFVVATTAAALATDYWVLAGARLATAATQALFWSVVGPTVTGLFPPGVRGRIVSRFAIGPSLAPVLGVPLATWVGQEAGWRTAFAVLAGLGLLAGAVVTALLPSFPPDAGGAARGTMPDARRFRTLLLLTALGITGAFCAQTYITPFLLDVSGFPESSLSLLLLVGGIAGVFGTIVIGRFIDSRPVAAVTVPLAVVGASLLLMYAFGTVQPVTVVLFALAGLAFSAFAAMVQGRTLQLAPGNTDLASAASGSAFNVGIAAGSLLGGVLLPAFGPRPLTLVGGLLVLAALAVALVDARRHRAPHEAARPVPVAAG